MIFKREVEKTNHFRSFVFEQRRQGNSEERFAKLSFSRKGVRGSENKKLKRKQMRQTTKRMKGTTRKTPK